MSSLFDRVAGLLDEVDKEKAKAEAPPKVPTVLPRKGLRILSGPSGGVPACEACPCRKRCEAQDKQPVGGWLAGGHGW